MHLTFVITNLAIKLYMYMAKMYMVIKIKICNYWPTLRGKSVKN